MRVPHTLQAYVGLFIVTALAVRQNANVAEHGLDEESDAHEVSDAISTQSPQEKFWDLATAVAAQNPKPDLSRPELSNMVQFLIDFAGTDTVIEAVIDWFTTLGQNWAMGSHMDEAVWVQSPVPTLIAQGSGAVHWIYYAPDVNKKTGVVKTKNGKPSDPIVYNSYEIGHQKKGSHQFCQSFAMIYLMCDRLSNLNGISKPWADQNCNNLQVAQNSNSEEEYWAKLGHNIKIVTSFWRMVLGTVTTAGGPDLAKWFADRFRTIAQEYVEHNQKNRRASAQVALMWPAGMVLDDAQVFANIATKLNIIDHFAEQIAKLV